MLKFTTNYSLMTVHILLIDDHPLVLEGVKTMLLTAGKGFLIHTFLRSSLLISFLEKEKADIVLMDINLSDDIDGVELCRIVKKKQPKIKVIALSNFHQAALIRNMLKSGADGYLLKNTTLLELTSAIEIVLRGESYLSNEIKTQMRDKNVVSNDYIPKLTRREKEILALIIAENTSVEIAEKLFLSINTIETHRMNLIQKLGVKNTAGLVRISIERGLLD